MTLLEKKRFIIDKIKESTSVDFISKLYDDVSQIEPWDETEDGKDLINRLLKKSQEQVKNGQVTSSEEHWAKVAAFMRSKNSLNL